jgi:hypothetical protein
MTSPFLFSHEFSKGNCFFNPLSESHVEIRRVEKTGKWNSIELIEAILKLKSDHPTARGGLKNDR